ncbi:MAG: winged helix-turn-helix domain-containing protein [Snowella sp.]|nr:winged helix-turn-helix domain-containing protein [Snowella sp.]
MSKITHKQISVDLDTQTVTYERRVIPLYKKEYELLVLFLKFPNKIFSYDSIIDELWDIEHTPTESNIRSHFRNIRKAFKKNNISVKIIENIYGIGYRLNPLFIDNVVHSYLDKPFNLFTDSLVNTELKLTKTKKYIVINEKFIVTYLSPEFIHDYHSLWSIALENDVRDIFPEFVQFESVIENHSEKKDYCFIIKGRAKNSGFTRLIYTCFDTIPMNSEHHEHCQEKFFYVFFEDIQDNAETILEQQNLP